MLKLSKQSFQTAINRSLWVILCKGMIKKITLIIFLFFLLGFESTAQTCTALGQNPQTAFPVCGTTVFSQNSVAICGDRALVSPCTTSTVTLTDKNPYWYKFTCYRSGTLGFVITPNNLNDDYDWQLFDVTGKNPANIYSDLSMFVACNWSGEKGTTGASIAGTSLILCDGPGVPLFSSMPNILIGHNYLLLISHFTDSQSGYSLSFGGGTGSITDPTDPHLESAAAACDGTVVTVKLNKKMKCRTLAFNGSDFSINTAVTNIISAVGNGCSSSFDTDSIILTLNNPLPAGSYIITMQNGIDANTLLDNCDRFIPVGENIPLTVYPVQATPMDSLTKPACAPQVLELVFRKPIRCNSIEPGGSDFVVTGTYPVTVISAVGNCVNGVSSKIFVKLSTPLQQAGNFQIKLVTGIDGNTVIDECGQQTPAGELLLFSIKDTVNATFSYAINLGCEVDVVNYNHSGANTVNNWTWLFDNQSSSNQQNPSISYSIFGNHQAQLIVSNGICKDTSAVSIFLNNTLKAGFESTLLVCPNDLAFFRDTSIGDIRYWDWNLGNGTPSYVSNPPPQSYLPVGSNYTVPIKLIVENNIGCKDTAVGNITVIWNCYIDVPSAFTPNNDGLNDYLYPLNAYKAKDLKFSVYNRLGQRVFYSEDWTQKWDGTFNGKKADLGTYVWMLQYTNTDTNKKVDQKGTVVLLR